MPSVKVHINPDGVKPVAKLISHRKIVLFKDSTIAEERDIDELSIDNNPYHFLYRSPNDILRPRVIEGINTPAAFIVYSNILNWTFFLCTLGTFIIFFSENTDFDYYFPSADLLLFTFIAVIVFSPELVKNYWIKNTGSKISISRHSRDDPFILEGKDMDSNSEYIALLKMIFLWSIITYQTRRPGGFEGPLICLGILFSGLVISKGGDLWSNIRNDKIKVELLPLQDFYTKTVELYSKESNKEPEITDLEELWSNRESQHLEFKSSVWASYNNQTGELIDNPKKNLKTEDSILKTIAGFLNTERGTLVIGVQERPNKRIVGIENDLQYSGGEKDIESFQNSLSELIRTACNSDTIIGPGRYVHIHIEPLHGKHVCVIDVKPRWRDSWTTVDLKKYDGGSPKKDVFFVRSGPQTKEIASTLSVLQWTTSTIEQRDEWEHSTE